MYFFQYVFGFRYCVLHGLGTILAPIDDVIKLRGVESEWGVLIFYGKFKRHYGHLKGRRKFCVIALAWNRGCVTFNQHVESCTKNVCTGDSTSSTNSEATTAVVEGKATPV